eukprot:3419450-Pyramimonas_sp.AAC.1
MDVVVFVVRVFDGRVMPALQGRKASLFHHICVTHSLVRAQRMLVSALAQGPPHLVPGLLQLSSSRSDCRRC